MKSSTSHDSDHAGLGAWALGLPGLALAMVVPPLTLLLLVGGLCLLAMTSRAAGCLLGLGLAVSCGFIAFDMLNHPQPVGDGWDALPDLLWVGIGLWIAAKSLTRKQ